MILSNKDQTIIPDLEYQVREDVSDLNSDREIQPVENQSTFMAHGTEYAEDKAKEIRAAVFLRSLETCRQETIFHRL